MKPYIVTFSEYGVHRLVTFSVVATSVKDASDVADTVLHCAFLHGGWYIVSVRGML
jgi:hypothetical protein